MHKPLKLKLASNDDLTIASALLQDAVVRVGDMAWQPASHRFAMVVNRYIWEEKRRFGLFKSQKKNQKKGRRVRTGLHFNTILKAEVTGFDPRNTDAFLSLLSLTVADETKKTDDTVILNLTFSGGAAIKLVAEYMDGLVSDLGESWEATRVPEH